MYNFMFFLIGFGFQEMVILLVIVLVLFGGSRLPSLAKGMGVPATRATTAEEFNNQLARSLAAPGPGLIEVVL